MGEDKLLIEFQGRTLLQRAVMLMVGLPVCERILVTTAGRLESLALPNGVRAVVNPAPEEGQSGSVRLGVAAATGEWYFFMLADQPLLNRGDLLPLLECAGDRDGRIIYPVINGNPGAPSLFSSRFRPELLALSGDTGGRAVREAHPEACTEFKPERPEHFMDVDSEKEGLL